ncbi:MAG: SIS domain-containing protein [Anaerolineaceae bacterium]|nr:SIS domain-containing protein [Anaerolineaceae bacterium]
MERGLYTRQEIYSQPEAWQAAMQMLAEQKDELLALSQGQQRQVLFTGCGSTYYLALAAAAFYQDITGNCARGLPASELWHYPQASYPNGEVLLVAISRSGATTETLIACKTFKEQKRGKLITLSCYAEEPLASMGDINLVFSSGAEQSIAQTRAFSTLYLGTVAFALIAAGRDDLYEELNKLPAVGQHILDTYSDLAKEIGGDLTKDRFYWLGSGLRYGLASELSLKMKEMSLTHSEPFHFMEFRHGPKSMITKTAQVIGLQSSSHYEHEQSVLNELKALGGKVLPIGEDQSTVIFNSGLDERIRNVLYLPFGQLVAFERSMAKGLNPDLPHNLDAVVKL